jgi:hypothetical protein
MKYLLFTIVVVCVSFRVGAQEKKVDTIYIKCPQEKLNTKYHSISPQKDSFSTVFSFNVNWKLHGYKKESIQFSFNSLSEHYKPGRDFFVKTMDTNAVKRFKNLYTLEQFTMALNEEKFLVPIFNGRVQIIMLYGAACLSKVEVYPVKVSTNLASEG